MNSLSGKIKLFVLLVACAAAAFFTLGGMSRKASAQAPAEQLTAAERRGKQIYLKGESEGAAEITAVLGGDDTEIPATAFACANCHGLGGEGKEEGGLAAPSLVWSTLVAERTSALTSRTRGPYTEAALARAIRLGVDPSGARLHPGMPHYRMADEQASDLIAYLKKLGHELDPGLSGGTIKVGAALPLSGSFAQIGQDIRDTLKASLAEVNEQGGVYGRRFELVVEDSRGDGPGTEQATRLLVERDSVFALIGSFEPLGGGGGANEFLRHTEVPLIGPVTLSPKLAIPPNRFVFYLLPTFGDQARSLVDFVTMRAEQEAANHNQAQSKAAAPLNPQPEKTRAAVIYMNGELEADALGGLRAQARLRSMEIVAEQAYEAGHFAPARAVELMSRKEPQYIFFFGSGGDIKAFAAEMERSHLNASLVSSVMMLGREAFELSPALAARTFLSYPSALPDQNDFDEFLGVMQRHGVGLRSPSFQTVAYAAAKTFIESVKLSTHQLSRPALMSALEGLREFRTGVIPPVSFGPNRRVGVEGSFIVGIDLKNKRYAALSEQLMPRGTP